MEGHDAVSCCGQARPGEPASQPDASFTFVHANGREAETYNSLIMPYPVRSALSCPVCRPAGVGHTHTHTHHRPPDGLLEELEPGQKKKGLRKPLQARSASRVAACLEADKLGAAVACPFFEPALGR